MPIPAISNIKRKQTIPEMSTKAPSVTKQYAYDAAVKQRDYGTAKTMNKIDFGSDVHTFGAKRRNRMQGKGFK